MARPLKRGLDYFPHDTSLSHDPKILILEAEYPQEGYACFLKLLEQLYSGAGYFLPWDPLSQRKSAALWRMPLDKAQKILSTMLDVELFAPDIFDRYQVLTSQRIQRTYLTIVERRKQIPLVQEFLLFDPLELIESPDQIQWIPVYARNNPIIESINPVNENISTQRKEKENTKAETKTQSQRKTETPKGEKAGQAGPGPLGDKMEFTRGEVAQAWARGYASLTGMQYFWGDKDKKDLDTLTKRLIELNQASGQDTAPLHLAKTLRLILENVPPGWYRMNISLSILCRKWNEYLTQTTQTNGRKTSQRKDRSALFTQYNQTPAGNSTQPLTDIAPIEPADQFNESDI